jgi:antitoxin HicB
VERKYERKEVTMRFGLRGKTYEIKKGDISAATKGMAPNQFDGRHRYFVELHGLKYPIKQAIHLATGLPNSDFHAGDAKRILEKLGFVVASLESEQESMPGHVTIANPSVEEGKVKFAVTLEQDEDGFVVASVPALPGCYSQGRTEDEAIANIKEAIRGYIASMRKHGEPIPNITEVREVEVAV